MDHFMALYSTNLSSITTYKNDIIFSYLSPSRIHNHINHTQTTEATPSQPMPWVI